MINNKTDFDRVVAFKNAAIADGFVCSPIYKSEPIDSACQGDKEGFRFQILTRDFEQMKHLFPWMAKNNPRYRYECSIDIWAPDKLCVAVPSVYNWQKLVDSTRKCSSCKTENVQTFRYSFAGRCCEKCLPKMKEIHEKPGWCD